MVHARKIVKKPTPNSTRQPHLTRRRVVGLVVLLLLLYVLLPQIGRFRDSFTIVAHAKIYWLVAGVVATVGTYVMSAGQYWFLAQKPLRFGRTLLVQGASAFTNRLLPAGIGGISLNVAYLRKAKHTFTQAGVVVGVNNVFGLAAHLLILCVILLLGVPLALHAHWHVSDLTYAIAAAVVIAMAALLFILKRLRRKFWRAALNVGKDLLRYHTHPLKVAAALGCAICLTLLYAVALYVCVRSVGWNLSFAKAFMVFTAGVGVATITPTPGGLVGAEAALAAGFVAYGLPAADSVAITLIYRLLTYWLPLAAGFVLFTFVGRRKYV